MKPNFKDGIVVAGISGRWPKSRNVHEFMENLLSGEDMIGGFNPISLRGSKAGVFVGTYGEESRTFLKTTTDDPNLLFGTFLSMLPNQVSFAFDFRGPSLVTDTACSSSLVALHEAILNIRSGQCDAAIVAGVNLSLDSDNTKRFNSLGMLSRDGKCKAFDISANGYVRSEAAVVVFICKESFARRSYAKILNAKVSSDGGKDQGILFPSGLAQEQLLREVYTEAGIDPENVSYLEAHGTGTATGDRQEVNAIDRAFCMNRHSGPLLIGSLKSNMGHSETASATTNNAVYFALSTVRDRERIGLLQLIQNTNIPGHRFRGYCIPEACKMEIEEMKSKPGLSQTWFILSDPVTFKSSNLVHHCACVCAIQIALVELLASIDIAPQQIFGHSFGEFSCAYVDGCYNIEETLLTSWAILTACVDSNLPPGAMASVGLRWDDNKTLSEGTFPACYNATDNMTVAGSPKSIKELLEHLKGAGIFARQINSLGFAFHSDLMKPAEAQMMENVRVLNLSTKTRSPKWISTSQSSDEIKLLSGRYFVNNILSPVLFHSAVERIPSHAVVIEIAPHGLFQTILKRSLPETCLSISLTDRNQSCAQFFLRSVGKLFVSGLHPKINQLYPELKFPLRSAAPPLSLLIQWNHQDSWKVADLPASRAGNDIEINLENPAHEFYCGYKINGQLLFPPSGFLVSIWRVLAEKVGTSMDHPITFENIVFNRACCTSTQYVTKCICSIDTSGNFEVFENGNSVVTGSVRFEDAEVFKTEAKFSENDKVYTQAEVYDRFRKVGYEFSGSFKSLLGVEVSSRWASTVWHKNWAVLLESLLQFEIFPNLSNQALMPSRIQKVSIDRGCLKVVTGQRIPTDMIMYRDPNLKLVSCDGIEIRGVELLPINCFGDFNQDSANIKAHLAAQSVSSFMLGFSKELAKQNIVGSYIAIERGILGLLNDVTGTTVGTDDSRQIGVEFSGLLSGHKVMGYARFEATTAQLISIVHWRVPDSWPLLDTATVPTAYATAYYALIIRGTLKHNESIWIQCGDEAVGEAAIA
ncbi:unnamed protein product, partial [Allacma fusca]